MKKLVSLTLVLALVLCLAATAFAADTETTAWNSPAVVEALPETVTLDAGEAVYYQLGEAWYGWELSIKDENAVIYNDDPAYIEMGWVTPITAVDGVVSCEISQNSMEGATVGICNNGTASATFTLVMTAPPAGSQYNPAELSLDKTNTCITVEKEMYGSKYYEYYYAFTATEGGYLTVKLEDIVADDFSIQVSNDLYESAYIETDYEGNLTDTVTVGVRPGGTVTIYIDAAQGEVDEYGWLTPTGAGAVSLSASFEKAELGDKYNPEVIEDQGKEYTFDVSLEAGEMYWVSLSDVEGATLTIADADAYIGTTYVVYSESYTYTDAIGAAEDTDGDDNVLTYEIYEEDQVLYIGTNSTAAVTYTVTVDEPLGYDENAEVVTDISNIEVNVPGNGFNEYYLVWTATADGKLNLTAEAEWGVSAPSWAIEKEADADGNPVYADVAYKVTVSVNGEEGISGVDALTVLDIKKDDTVVICVESLSWEEEVEWYGSVYTDVYGPYEIDVTLNCTYDVLGSIDYPVEILNPTDLNSVSAAAGGTTYYAISTWLNGMEVTVVDDGNIKVTLNGTELTAADGVFTGTLDSYRGQNQLIVTNTSAAEATETPAAINWPLGTEGNPIQIGMPSELTGVEVDANSETYYLISSMLNGMILNVNVNENVTVTVNGVEQTPVNGVVSVVLDSMRPTNQVIVSNAADTNVELVASLDYAPGTENNPYVVTMAEELTSAKVEAGAAVYYAVSSNLNGMTLTVTGDANTTVTVNGVELVADENGVFTVSLTGSPVNQVIIANSGDEAAEYAVELAYPNTDGNPGTGDVTILGAIASIIMSGMGTVALVAKKKVF